MKWAAIATSPMEPIYAQRTCRSHIAGRLLAAGISRRRNATKGSWTFMRQLAPKESNPNEPPPETSATP